MKPELLKAIKLLSNHCKKQMKGVDVDDECKCACVCGACELNNFCYGTIPQWESDLEELEL